jgi:hypothetical protein
MSCVMGCHIYQSSPCVRETLESGQQESRDCIQRKTWCMGPYVGVDYNSPFLIVNSVVSYPTPLKRERDGVGNVSPIA